MSDIAITPTEKTAIMRPERTDEGEVTETFGKESEEEIEMPRVKRRSFDSGVRSPERPTYLKVRIRHIVPETLDHYRLPWEYDSKDKDYLIIRKYIPYDFQQELFRHTNKVKRERLAQLEPSSIPAPASDSGSDRDSHSRRRRGRRSRSPPRSQSQSRSRSRSRSGLSYRSDSDSHSGLDRRSDSDLYSDLETRARKNSVYDSDDSSYAPRHAPPPPPISYRQYGSNAPPRMPYNPYESHVPQMRQVSRYKSHTRKRLYDDDDKYLPPKDTNGVSLSLEIDIADRDTFYRPDLSTRKTVDLAKDDTHLREHLHLQGLIKASIMTARQSTAEDDTLGVALDYLNGPKHLPDSHFRWIHAQMPKLSLHQYQHFIAQLSELDKEEQALILSLLKESTTMASSSVLPLFRVKRADAKKLRGKIEPVKWTMHISTQYLARTTFRYEEGHSIPFARYQHPLEAVNTSDHQNRIHSIHRMSPVHNVNVVRFSAFLTSSGALITFSHESFTGLCQGCLSITELQSPPRKVRMHIPDGKEFHFPLKLCETHFALMRAVAAAYGKTSTEISKSSKNYAAFDAKGVQIEAVDWEQYYSSQTGPWIDVWIRPMPVEDEVVVVPRGDRRSRSKVYITRVASSEGSHKRPRFATSEHLSKHRTKVSAIREKSGYHERTKLSKHGIQSAPQRSRTQQYAVAEDGLPPDSNVVTNQAQHQNHKPNDLLFRKSKHTRESTEDLLLRATKPAKSKQDFENDTVSAETGPPRSTSAHILPFFQWPIGDTESMTETQAGPQSLEDLDYVLTEVDTLLSRGKLDKKDGRESRENLAKLYKAHSSSHDSQKVEGVIKTGLSSHRPLDISDEDVITKSSWQDLLYEVIQRWDSLIGSFCTVEYDHVILKSFKNARTAFFEDISSIFEAQYTAAQNRFESGSLKNTACFILDHMEVLDDRTTASSPVLPEVTLEDCKDCQWTDTKWPIYANRKAAISHLREQHFRSGRVDVVEMERYIMPARYLDSVGRCLGAQIFMMSILDYLGEATDLIDGIRSGVAGSFESRHPYRLPISLVNAFRQFIGGILHAAAASNAIKMCTGFGSDEMSPGKRDIAREVEQAFKSGTSLESALSNAKHDLILQSHASDYSTAVSYRVVDSPYVLINILASLIGKSYSPDALNLTSTYKDSIDLLRTSMRINPGKRLHNDILRLGEEVEAIRKLMLEQAELLSSLLEVLKPESFAITTKERQKQYKLEEKATLSIRNRLDEEIMLLEYLKSELERIESENIRAFGIQQDDHGKAILVFTIVTVIFLPLSFATSFLGMNTNDIRNMNSTQWLFWAIAIPLTLFTMALVVIVGYHGEQIREILSSILGRMQTTQKQSLQRKPHAADIPDYVREIGRPKQNGLRQEV